MLDKILAIYSDYYAYKEIISSKVIDMGEGFYDLSSFPVPKPLSDAIAHRALIQDVNYYLDPYYEQLVKKRIAQFLSVEWDYWEQDITMTSGWMFWHHLLAMAFNKFFKWARIKILIVKPCFSQKLIPYLQLLNAEIFEFNYMEAEKWEAVLNGTYDIAILDYPTWPQWSYLDKERISKILENSRFLIIDETQNNLSREYHPILLNSPKIFRINSLSKEVWITYVWFIVHKQSFLTRYLKESYWSFSWFDTLKLSAIKKLYEYKILTQTVNIDNQKELIDTFKADQCKYIQNINCSCEVDDYNDIFYLTEAIEKRIKTLENRKKQIFKALENHINKWHVVLFPHEAGMNILIWFLNTPKYNWDDIDFQTTEWKFFLTPWDIFLTKTYENFSLFRMTILSLDDQKWNTGIERIKDFLDTIYL